MGSRGDTQATAELHRHGRGGRGHERRQEGGQDGGDPGHLRGRVAGGRAGGQKRAEGCLHPHLLHQRAPAAAAPRRTTSRSSTTSTALPTPISTERRLPSPIS